jgi:hypothetical protein
MRPDRLGLWLRSYGNIPGYRLEQKETVAKTKEHAVNLGLPADMVDTALNRISYGMNVLASIPDAEYVRRMEEKLEEQLDKIDASKEQFHEKGSTLPGVRTFEEHPKETADRKGFATRTDRPFSGQTGVGASPALRRRAASRRGG